MGAPHIRPGEFEEKSLAPTVNQTLDRVRSAENEERKKERKKERKARKLRTVQLHKQLCYSYTEGGAAVCKTNILLPGAFSHNSYSNRRPRLSPTFTQGCRLQSQYDNKSRSSGANRLLAPPAIPLLQRKYFVSSL